MHCIMMVLSLTSIYSIVAPNTGMELKISITSSFTMIAHVYTCKHHHVMTVYNTHDNNVVDRFIARENRAQHETYTFNRLYSIGLVRVHHTMST